MKREVISLVKVNERIGKSVLKLSKGPWIKIFRTDAQTLKGEKRRKSCGILACLTIALYSLSWLALKF